MDLKSFFKMSYGLYLISSKSGEQTAGCLVNTLTQVTAEPPRITLAIHKDNFTTGIIRESGLFTAVALSEDASMDLMGAFGFHSSKDGDKFKSFETRTDENGIPYVCTQTVARYSCKVLDSMDAGTHTIFLGEVLEAQSLSDAEPMTYTYYHKVKNGITPPKASSYQPEAAAGYRCKICGYVLKTDTLPPDFLCPICKRGSECFEKI